jgi:hypothetical protein
MDLLPSLRGRTKFSASLELLEDTSREQARQTTMPGDQSGGHLRGSIKELQWMDGGGGRIG